MRRTGVLLACASLVLVGAPARGQTLFEWPDTAVDVSSYATIEECHAAIARVQIAVRDRAILAGGVWRDTMPVLPGEDIEPVPDAVRETARSCGQRHSAADSVDVVDFSLLVPVYLAAGWDDKARTLVRRRLLQASQVGGDAPGAVLDTVVRIYAGKPVPASLIAVKPPRPDLVDEVVQEYLDRVPDRVRRLNILLERVELAVLGGLVDTARIEQLGPAILALVDSLTEAELGRFTENWAGIVDDRTEVRRRLRARVYRAMERLQDWNALLDSLRVSTQSFAREYRRQVRTMARENQPYGEPAPVLVGDVWLGCDGRCESRPAPGRVSLIVFYYHGEPRRGFEGHRHEQCPGVIASPEEFRLSCAAPIYVLRRLIDRFPDLDVTLVTRTRGHFAYEKESITVEREAELVRRWLESFGVRAVIGMTETDHWRLPNHDRRRIEEPTVNEENYSFDGAPGLMRNWTAVVVDRDGLVVWRGVIDRATEQTFSDVLQVLFERGGSGR